MSENSMPTETQELSPIAPNVSVAPVPPKKFPILIIILLLLLGTLSIFTVYLFLEVRTLTLDKTTPSPSPSPTASSTTDQGSEWSTYQNNKFKYSYKMPVGYKVKPFAGTQDEINEAGDYIILNQVGEEYARVTTRSEANYPSLKMVKGESINGYDSYYSTTPAGYNGDPNPYLHVELISQGTSIKFTFINRELLNSLDKQLLSTFKFTNPTTSPSTSPKLTQLKYSLPTGWTKTTDPTYKFEIAYDPADTQVLESAVEGINLTRKSLNDNGIGFTSYMSIQLLSYDGGSKHSFIYKNMNDGKAPQKQDLASSYNEKEYSYNGKNCLFLNGIYLSQFPQIWGMCDAGGGTAYLISSYEPSPTVYLKTVQTIRLK